MRPAPPTRRRACSSASPPTGTLPGRGGGGTRARAAVLATALYGIAGATLSSDAVRAVPPAPPDRAGAAPPRTVQVYNAERDCRGRADRDPRCSLGLAIDPVRPYTAENVVPTRVWHGDVLGTDCQVWDGETIIDEEDRRSTRWFRVRLPSGPEPRTAWLPAVRARERPALPECS